MTIKRSVLSIATNTYAVPFDKFMVSLINLGYSVTVLALDRGNRCEFEGRRDLRIMKFCQILAGHPLPLPISLLLFSFWAFIKGLSTEADYLLCHDLDTLQIGLLLKMVKKKPLVYNCNNLYWAYPLFEKGPGSQVLSRLLSGWERLVLRFVDHQFVPTESVGGQTAGFREYYLSIGQTPARITTIWDVPRKDFGSGVVVRRPCTKPFIIGYIGTIRFIEPFEWLISSIKILERDGYGVLVVGDGPKNKKVKKLLVESGIKNLTVSERVNYLKTSEIYSSCSLQYALYPAFSNVERAMAIKIFESAYVGVPVITNKNTLMGTLVEKYGIGETVDPSDVEELCHKIDKIKNRWENYSEACGNFKIEWCWEKEAEKIARIFSDLTPRREDSSIFLNSRL